MGDGEQETGGGEGEKKKPEPLALQLAKGSLVAPLATAMYAGTTVRSRTHRDKYEAKKAQIAAYGILGMAILGCLMFLAAVVAYRRKPVPGFWKYAGPGGVISALILAPWLLAVMKPRAAPDLLAEGSNLMRQGQYADAEAVLTNFVATNAPDDARYELGLAQSMLGMLQARQARYADAVQSLQLSTLLLGGESGTADGRTESALMLGITQEALASTLMDMGDLERAEAQSDAALQTKQMVSGTNNGLYAVSLRTRGLIRARRGDLRSLDDLWQAAQLAEHDPKTKPQLTMYRADYVALLRATDQHDEAERMETAWNLVPMTEGTSR